MKNQKICKIKYENIIFIVLATAFIFNSTINELEYFNPFGIFANFIGLTIQLTISYLVKFGVRYIRKNPQTIAESWNSLFKD